jgi:hypothetical protein
MKRALFILVLAVMCRIAAAGQERLLVEVSSDRTEINIKFGSGQSMPARFGQFGFKNIGNYILHELEPLDEPGSVSKDRTDLLLSQPGPECLGFNCQTIKLHLRQALNVNQTYILVLQHFTNAGSPVTIRFDVKPSPSQPEKAAILKGPDAYNQRAQLLLRSKTPIEVAAQIEVRRLRYKLTPDNTGYVEDPDLITADVEQKTDTLFVLKLHRKLTENEDLNLSISDGISVKGQPGQSVRAEGKIKLGGIPTKPDEIRLDLNLASVAAVKQKPVFDLTGKLIPTRIYQVLDTDWIWEPTVNVDVGLRSTKSANSVTLAPLNFSKFFGENWKTFQAGRRPTTPPTLDRKYRDGTIIPTYANWMNTPWYRPSDIKFTWGPKAEFDRNFKRKNILGSLSFDFDFHRWRASTSDKRRVLEQDFGEDVAKAMRINYGWSTVPYIRFDFGGHVSNETVNNAKKKVSVLVPRHKIFRTYFGLLTTFESNKFYLPLTFSIDESVFCLASPETIGFITDSGVGLRRLHGFHHRGKATLSFALDPAKHYSLSLSYENGRLAPNFEYLNKLTTGLRVVFW